MFFLTWRSQGPCIQITDDEEWEEEEDNNKDIGKIEVFRPKEYRYNRGEY